MPFNALKMQTAAWSLSLFLKMRLHPRLKRTTHFARVYKHGLERYIQGCSFSSSLNSSPVNFYLLLQLITPPVVPVWHVVYHVVKRVTELLWN